MTVTFRGVDVPVAARYQYWRDTVTDVLGPLDIRIDGSVGAGDRLTVAQVGPASVGVLTAGDPATISRTRTHVNRMDSELYKVDILTSGGGTIWQGRNEIRLRPGDLTFVDLSRPVSWSMAPSRVVAFVFPRRMLPLEPDELSRLTAVRIPGDRGPGALVSALTRQIPGRLDQTDESAGVRIATAVVDLVSVALAARLECVATVPDDTRRRALLQQIFAFTEEHLGDADLSPSQIASAHHISLRYLHKLFATQQVTVGGWVRRRRLELARRDLSDPLLSGRPVGAIAARRGFASAAHFSRAFREAYGVPPGEYRLWTIHNGGSTSPAKD